MTPQQRARVEQIAHEHARAVRWEAEAILATLPVEPAYLIARRRAILATI